MGIRGSTVDDVRGDGTTAEEGDGHPATRTRGAGIPKAVKGSAVNDVASVHSSDPGGVASPTRPVFVDATGKRGRTWRRTGIITALCCVCYATALTAALVGGDSGAPYLQLPLSLGPDRGAEEQSPRSRDGGRAAVAAESTPGTPGPVASGPVAFGPAGPSAPVRSAVPHSLQASGDAAGVPAVGARSAAPTSGPRPSAPVAGASGGSAQSDEGTADAPSSPAPDDGSGSGAGGATVGGDDAQGQEPEETDAPDGPLGDLLGDLLGGLLGGA
ncbi:hypothetical protein OG379_29110 [Streptomyces sp. NBC_01166]|uniref:hypothetical protein n=1 Tax=Streptomyces sp. NBC_01166 TaxID=2903755 RepID=UPI00386E1865|nr:hypothetical protein OG379_29110 [Streptomyces sp. NBC_01166]